MRGNNWRQKREEQHNTHNRKPGRGKYWKRLTNRKGRRWGSIIRKEMVDGKRPIY